MGTAPEVLRLLVSAGADPNLCLEGGGTALSAVAAAGDCLLVEEFIDSGVDVGVVDDLGWTALDWAAAFGHPRCVSRLVSAGGAIERRGPDGFTALHRAALFGSGATVRALLRGGADFAARTPGGASAEVLARAYVGDLEARLRAEVRGLAGAPDAPVSVNILESSEGQRVIQVVACTDGVVVSSKVDDFAGVVAALHEASAPR